MTQLSFNFSSQTHKIGEHSYLEIMKRNVAFHNIIKIADFSENAVKIGVFNQNSGLKSFEKRRPETAISNKT